MKSSLIKVTPLNDESPVSWVTRIAQKYHCDLNLILEHYNITEPSIRRIDIDFSNFDEFKIFLPNGSELPNTISQKIRGFNWNNGRSSWVIAPNTKSDSLYTQVCPSCLEQRGYIQLKWKLPIFIGCIYCKCYLIDRCSNCGTKISVNSTIFFCSNCLADLRNEKRKALLNSSLTEMKKLYKAYSETPVNHEYLELTLYRWEVKKYPSKKTLFTETEWLTQYRPILKHIKQT